MAACRGKHLRLLFGSAPLTHGMWKQILFLLIIIIWDVVTTAAQEEEENSPADRDKRH